MKMVSTYPYGVSDGVAFRAAAAIAEYVVTGDR